MNYLVHINQKFIFICLLVSIFLDTKGNIYEGSDYENFKTTVRLKTLHGRSTNSDCVGLGVMFHSTHNDKDVWMGEVLFMPSFNSAALSQELYYTFPRVKGVFTNISGTIKAQFYMADQILSSRESPSSSLSPGVSSSNTSSTSSTVSTTPWRGRNFQISYLLTPKFLADVEEVEHDHSKNWKNSSLFEWDLKYYTIDDIVDKLKAYKEGTQGKIRFKYTKSGVAYNDHSINCCQFACHLLSDLGIKLRESSFINQYLNHTYSGAKLWPPFNLPFLRKMAFTPSKVIREIIEHHEAMGAKFIVIEEKSLMGHRKNFNIHTLLTHALESREISADKIEFLLHGQSLDILEIQGTEIHLSRGKVRIL